MNMRNKKIMAAVCGIFVILLIAGITIYNRPEIKMLQAVKQLKQELNKYENPLLEEVDLLKIYQNKQEQCYYDQIACNVKLPKSLTENSLLQNIALDTVSVNMDRYFDNQQKRVQGSLGLGIGSFNLAKGNVYMIEDQAYLSVPELLEDTYVVNLSTFGRDFNQSELSELLGVKLPQNFGVYPFSNGSSKDWEEYGQILSQLTQHAKQLKSYVKLENTNEKLVMDRNGKKVTGKAVRLTVKEYALNDMAQYANHAILSSNLYKNQFRPLLQRMNFSDDVEEQILTGGYQGDLVIHIYLDQKRNILGLETVSPIVYEEGEIAFSIKASGAENIYDKLHVDFDRKTTEGNDCYAIDQSVLRDAAVCTNELVIAENNITVLDYHDEWDMSNQSIKIKGTMPEQLSVDIKAEIQNIVPGESFDLNIVNLVLDVEGEEPLQMAVKYSQKPVDTESIDWIQQDIHAKELFTLTKVDLFRIAYEAIKSAGGSLLPF